MRLLLFIIACSSACGAPPTKPPAAAMQVDLAVDASADGSVALVAGAQGGFHVWLRYVLGGAPDGVLTLARRAERLSDGQVVLRLDTTLSLPADASASIPMFMCPTPVGLSVIDERLRLSLAVIDDQGAELGRSALEVTPTCPTTPTTQADFCHRICSGG